MSGANAVTARLRAWLEPRGFDLLHPFRVGCFNDTVEPRERLEDWGSADNLALIVGNTRALWPLWLAALRSDPALASQPHPLDAYTERSLHDALAGLALPARARFAHETGDRVVPIQRVAHAAGFAFLTETHMSVHPIYGPWIALRAVVSLEVSGPAGAPARMAHPCGSCAQLCRPAFERALSTFTLAPSEANARAHWQEWLACRDACPIGREHRYSEAQIAYHYRRRLVLPKAK